MAEGVVTGGSGGSGGAYAGIGEGDAQHRRVRTSGAERHQDARRTGVMSVTF